MTTDYVFQTLSLFWGPQNFRVTYAPPIYKPLF